MGGIGFEKLLARASTELCSDAPNVRNVDLAPLKDGTEWDAASRVSTHHTTPNNPSDATAACEHQVSRYVRLSRCFRGALRELIENEGSKNLLMKDASGCLGA